LGQCGDKRRKSRDACIPKGSPWSLIHLFGRKLTSFVQQHFFRYKKIHQTLDRSRLRRFLMLGASHLDYKKFDGLLANLSSRMTVEVGLICAQPYTTDVKDFPKTSLPSCVLAFFRLY
jgi:hypothetical protein